ncbi:biliverdin-producing heme oxygenase [Deinococcus sp.]|uniref:biliverdin-producing heme oxygenase n=1 Tax=Deinococcus sp. TaxID=47478 RepID=UPI002869D70B|nr:biliverdin-producing heme oxygenase [Deinococcus sp.]
MILAQLKADTRELHDHAEAALNLLDPGLTRERYVEVLRGLHALYTPLCEDIGLWLAGHAALDWPARRAVKVDALGADLRDLGARPAAPRAVPTLPGEAHAWGALYVLEGATLGGQLLRRHMAAQLNLGGLDQKARGLAFFSSYGDQVGPRWKAFGAALTARCSGEDAAFHAAVVDGARHTFALFSTLAGRVEARA